jgi:RNA polymerase sigma-70 factor (ECF subfamily)
MARDLVRIVALGPSPSWGRAGDANRFPVERPGARTATDHGGSVPFVDRTMTSDVHADLAPAEGDLMARVAAGDEAAFAAVYDRTIDAVFGSVVRFLNGDREAAADVVQEAYLAVWRQADRYQPESGSLKGWILAIARNRAIDRLRAAARRPVIVRPSPTDDGASDAEAEERLLASGRPVLEPSEYDDPEAAAGRRWLIAVVRTALGGLSPQERQVLALAYDDGLTQSEIAARLGWPLGTVKTRTRRAFSTMRALLEGVPDVAPAAFVPPEAAARASVEGDDHGSR